MLCSHFALFQKYRLQRFYDSVKRRAAGIASADITGWPA